jgi:hypothetical protein
MKPLRLTLFVVLVGFAVAFVRPTVAGVDIDLGAHVAVDDRTDLYFSISSNYFDRDRETIDRWGPRFYNPDDLAVALFIAHRSGQSLETLWALYQQRGLSWWDISVRFGIPVDAWFVEVDRAPGPPYGKAYGHWKKHRHDRDARVRLSDDDLRNLVAVRMAHEYYGVSVEVAMDWRSDGRDVSRLMCDEYRRRHGGAEESARVTSGNTGRPGKAHGKSHKKDQQR